MTPTRWPSISCAVRITPRSGLCRHRGGWGWGGAGSGWPYRHNRGAMTLSIRCSGKGGVMVDLSKTRVRGPLEPVMAGFAAELVAQGYTLYSARSQMALAAHLSRWLAGQDLGVPALTAEVVEAFLAARRGQSRWTASSPKS